MASRYKYLAGLWFVIVSQRVCCHRLFCLDFHTLEILGSSEYNLEILVVVIS
jgi:hypothetical protein